MTVSKPFDFTSWLARSLFLEGYSVATAMELSSKLIVVDLDISGEDWRQAYDFGKPFRGLQNVLYRLILEFNICPLCRCVDMSRLDPVLRTGIDVEPSSEAFWADPHVSDALPHGGDPKLLLVLSRESCLGSLRCIEPGMTKAEVNALKRDYPYRVIDPHIEGTWFSRLPNKRANRHREPGQGYWIPGDAQKALLAAIVLSSRESRPKAHKMLNGRGATLKRVEEGPEPLTDIAGQAS
jgi:hypothetical protein